MTRDSLLHRFGLMPHTLAHYVTHGQSRDFHGFPHTHTYFPAHFSPIASLFLGVFLLFFSFFLALETLQQLSQRAFCCQFRACFPSEFSPHTTIRGRDFLRFPLLLRDSTRRTPSRPRFISLTLSVRFSSSFSSSSASFSTSTCPHTSQRDYF